MYRKYHISTFFWRKIIFHFLSKKRTYFLIIQETYSSVIYFGIIIFSGHLKKISYFHVFFLERSSFIFRLKKKIIFSEKRNIIFPDNTRRKMKKDDLKKISYFHVFFCERSSLIFCLKNKMTFFWGKNIFPSFFWKDHLFRTIAKRKYGFSCSKI